jgi:hypothetical protein
MPPVEAWEEQEENSDGRLGVSLRGLSVFQTWREMEVEWQSKKDFELASCFRLFAFGRES